MLSHLHFGLNNLRVSDLTLMCNSCMSLTIAGMNLLFEGLSEPFVKHKCYVAIYVSDLVSFGHIKIIKIGNVSLNPLFDEELAW